MYIVHVATELTPIAKVGGLGDMIQGLLKALVAEGEKVEVILPFYDQIDRSQLKNLTTVMKGLSSYEDMGTCKNTIWSATADEIPITLIESHDTKRFFKRGKIYGEKDDCTRFIYFCRVAMEYLLKQKKSPDVLHLHDWLTALCAPLYREVYHNFGLKIGKVVTTIHNMKYQGQLQPEALSAIGLHPDSLLKRSQLQDPQKPNRLNLLKGAFVDSDTLTTVSPTYAEEIKGDEGWGLGPTLIEHQSKLKGIINGIDTKYWNPATDKYLQKKYVSDPSHLDELLEAKKINRRALSKKTQLPQDTVPLFACVTRLVKQKGPKLIAHAIEYVFKKGGQFILLGTPSEEEVKKLFYNLKDEYQDNPHVHFHFEFDEGLAHLIYGSADFLLIPSLFEPCGLTQMIALRYGTIPIVHTVGGLKDTIFDIDHEEIPLSERNGYTFDFPSPESLSWSIDRSIEHFKHDKEKRHTMLKNGLKKDWSFKKSALDYLEVYR